MLELKRADEYRVIFLRVEFDGEFTAAMAGCIGFALAESKI
jgi:hypothetical protein